jgi:endonuclease YncB( thermonuclease family)
MKKRIARWVDGDSGHFTDGSGFRLARVRAPEKHQFGGSTATRRAAGMTARSNGNVNVQVVGRSYGRTVVEMRNADGSINNRMIRRGCWKKGR